MKTHPHCPFYVVIQISRALFLKYFLYILLILRTLSLSVVKRKGIQALLGSNLRAISSFECNGNCLSRSIIGKGFIESRLRLPVPPKAVTPNHAEREHDQIVKYLLSAVSTFNANRSGDPRWTSGSGLRLLLYNGELEVWRRCRVCGCLRITRNWPTSCGVDEQTFKGETMLFAHVFIGFANWRNR